MMMSIFSSFDALAGEFFGQKTNELPASLSRQANDSAAPAKPDGGKSSSSSSPALVTEKRKQGERSQEGGKRRVVAGPRFAVELDGVHCFETLVRH